MRFVSLVVPASILLCHGCAHAAPAPAAPWTSPNGVRVAVVDETCDVLTDPDFVDNDLVEVSLSFEVSNATAREVRVHRDRLRLMGPDGVAPGPSTWGASTPVSVSPGETKTIRVSFVNRGSLRCDAALDLSLRDVLTSGSSSLPPGRIRLLARQ